MIIEDLEENPIKPFLLDSYEEVSLAIEPLLEVEINGPGKTTFLGNKLIIEEKKYLVKLLVEYHDIFAWSYSDIPGIDLSIIYHYLNIDEVHKLIRQPRRVIPEKRASAIDEKIEKLKSAGFIREVDSPTWLANSIIVKKKNRK